MARTKASFMSKVLSIIVTLTLELFYRLWKLLVLINLFVKEKIAQKKAKVESTVKVQ